MNFSADILHDIDICFICTCLHVLFGFPLKAEGRRSMTRRVVPAHAEAPHLVPASSAKKGKQSVGAPRKTGVQWAPRSCSVRGRGGGSTKVIANRLLVDAEAGAFNELPLVIRQSFKDGRYSPSTRVEEIEWQIVLEQFIVSGVVVKDEIINIDRV
jgi:hypothetical protein